MCNPITLRSLGEMSTLFRRIRSPREHREKEEHAPPNRSFSTGQIQLPGHRRHKSDEIRNIVYTDPNGVSNSHGPDSPREENPPLPPRNLHGYRPASVGHAHQFKKQPSSDEDPYYVAPADTIGRKAGLSALQGPTPTVSEQRVIEMHQRTQSQKAVSVLGHRRTGSFGHVIDNSEYSTPWNLLQQQRDKENSAATASSKVPPKPPRSRDRTPPKRPIIHSQPSDGSDDQIPVHSPPPPLDRSLTNSPCSPTNPSDDYDEPWDKKYPDLRRAVRRQHSGKLKSDGEVAASGSGSSHNRHSSHHEPHHRNSRSSPQPEPRQRETSRISDRISPPLILSRSTSGGELRPKSGNRSQSERLRQLSPQPDMRPRVTSRGTSEKCLRDQYLSAGADRNSPPQLEPQSWGSNPVRDRQRHQHHSPAEYLPPSHSPEGTPRSGSVSTRRLPTPPPDAGEPRLDGRRYTRTSSPPSIHIDLSLALEDQQ